MNEQRRLFYSKGSLDNKGELLSQDEKQALADCLNATSVPVYSWEEINAMCREAYGRDATHMKNIYCKPGARELTADIPFCVHYGYDPYKNEHLDIKDALPFMKTDENVPQKSIKSRQYEI